MDIAMVLHSKTKDNVKDGGKYSEVMTEIISGALRWNREHQKTECVEETMYLGATRSREVKRDCVNLTTFSNKRTYSDIEEFYQNTKDAIATNPDVLILPFSFCETEYQNKFANLFYGFAGKVVAVNVDSDGEFEIKKMRDGQYLGYSGQNDYEVGIMMGKMLSKIGMNLGGILLSRHMSFVGLLNHKKSHHGIETRIGGIRTKLNAWRIGLNIYVGEGADLDYEEKIIKFVENDSKYKVLVSFGIRGTEIAIKIKEKLKSDFIILGMDENNMVRQAIKDGIVYATVCQDAQLQGYQAMDIAYNGRLRQMTYVLDKDNINSYK